MDGNERGGWAGGLLAALTRFVDLIYAGLLWLLLSIPLVTVGPASTALYYTVAKSVRRERGGVTVSFFSRFRADFRISLLLWLICLAYILVGVADIWAFTRLGIAQSGVLYYVSRLYFVVPLVVVPWLFPYVSRFQNTVGGSLRAAGYLALKNLWRTLLMTALALGFGLIIYLIPLLFPLLPGVYCFICSLMIEPVFRALTLEKDEDGNADRWYNE